MTTIGAGIPEGQFDRYLRASEDWVDPEGTSWVDDDGVIHTYEEGVRGTAKIKRLPAKGGPFDGEELQVPPGGAQVILPAAFGKEANLKGVCVYERQGQFMVYMGQGDHTEQVDDEEDDGPQLIVVGR